MLIIEKHIGKRELGTIFKFIKMKKVLLLLTLVLPFLASAQQTISLDECFELVTENFPLAEQSVLLSEQSRLDIEAINKGKLPKLDVNAQATYQSDVTSLPIQLPNVTVEPPNKDQYRATLDVTQSIYNGGIISANAKVTPQGVPLRITVSRLPTANTTAAHRNGQRPVNRVRATDTDRSRSSKPWPVLPVRRFSRRPTSHHKTASRAHCNAMAPCSRKRWLKRIGSVLFRPICSPNSLSKPTTHQLSTMA